MTPPRGKRKAAPKRDLSIPPKPAPWTPNFTGIWEGWRWVNGKPIERAPAVSR